MKQKILNIVHNPLAKNSLIMFVGTMAVNFGAYLYQVVVLRIMGPAQYSELAALFSILFIISVPAQVAQTILTKFFSERKANNDLGGAKSLLLKTYQYLAIISIVGLGIYVPLIPVMQSTLKIQEVMSFIGLYGVFVTFFIVTIGLSVLNGFQRFAASTFFATISMILRFLSGYLFASMGVAITVVANSIANVISIFFFLIPLGFILKVKAQPFSLPKKETVAYAVPALFVLLGITMLYNLDVVLVKSFFNPELAGIYGGLTIFGKIIFFAATAILLAVFPMVAEKKALGKPHNQIVWAGFAGIVIMSALIVLFYFLLAPVVTNILFGPRFSGVVPYLGLFGVFMSAVTIINYIAVICLAINKTGVWKIIMSGAMVQIAGLILFHSNLYQVIWVNIIVTVVIAVATLLYYSHEPKRV